MGLRRVDADEVAESRPSMLDAETMETVARIVEDVRSGGVEALRRHATRLGDIEEGGDLVVDRDDLTKALDSIDSGIREVLLRVASRIERFARAQRDAISDLDMEVDGGRAGHRWVPIRAIGGYVPGGRYPLPSTALMIGVPARVAGVDTVWISSPRPSPITLAAAAVAGADGVLAVGGAQAVAALAFGIEVPGCDLIVGPGNRWVTAAKKYLFGEVGIDALAGPSEILVIADDAADPGLVAADLLAQAEHDVDAAPLLVTTSAALAEEVDSELTAQLADLPTSGTAAHAIRNGLCVVVGSLDDAVAVANRLAPEHLALHVGDARIPALSLTEYGSLFVGANSAEVFADYGVGPNHVLPTGGTARFTGGLSVFTFMKARTWSQIDEPVLLVPDTVLLSRLEGLEAHARAASRRGSG